MVVMAVVVQWRQMRRVGWRGFSPAQPTKLVAGHHFRLGHRIFRHLDVLLVVRSREGTLIDHAQSGPTERIVRLYFAGTDGMCDRLVVLPYLAVQDRQCRMRQRLCPAPRPQFCKFLDSEFVSAVVLPTFGLVLQTNCRGHIPVLHYFLL